MIECDLHIHSLRSTCGYHTLLEIVSILNKTKLKGFALTDHSPIHDTPRAHFSVMLRRLPPVIEGLRVFKGIESAILDEEGELDLPLFEGIASYEVVLAGLHNIGRFENNSDKEKNTRAVINTMKKNPAVKVITHPFFEKFPLDLDAVSDIALETNTALEINNAYLLTKKADTDALACLLELAAVKGNLLCVNSDGHVFHEMGQCDLAADFISDFTIDPAKIVNRTLESTLSFLGLES